MKLKNHLLVFIYFVISTITAQNVDANFTIITQQEEFVAGSEIILEFKTNKPKNYRLYCTNSYGSSILDSEINGKNVIFRIPDYLNNKIGVVSWMVLENKISGEFKINPKENPVVLETYLGPPSIEAGGTDFTMMVVIPTDNLDNPLKQNTAVNINQQFLDTENTIEIFTNNLIAYDRIFSPVKSGRMLLSSKSLDLNSKEYDVNIMPAIGTNFDLFTQRNHEYADGNQITTFSTSIIKDKNNNVVSDGTFVDFFIANKKGNILKTSGTTINGVAFAKMIHPEWEENWSVKAYINGIAESEVLEISYKKAITDFEVIFSENNRKLTIGPLKSFMNQMIPDGLQVKLSISKNGKIIDEIIKKSKDGFVVYDLNSNMYKNDTYDLVITTAEIAKTFQSKKLW